ncbi:hypothetical protein Ssi02_18480 [Sinosporangium siamense]|uniref:Protein kinase domain-containing protein n=1 Tax=Sinosporangium siamense TaxID=1367973 RepID=A0A919RDV2_9ACTN|nr:hypothetical protein Ssi02_18480 [Sinosporangium siamense]
MLGRLGRGGMGTVYLGEDNSGQRVAVKVINPGYSQNERFRSRFRREADAARRVRPFCTAAVLEAALDGDQLYVVTEYVPGLNLEESIKQFGPLHGSNLSALAVGVATALTAIHGAGVVHRDLKPSNVLLSPIGPRVIDFGIARALDTLGGVTTTGEILGTPRYMAPEVLRGEPTSPACDVFSWGCLVAYASSGRHVFNGEGMPAIVYQVLNAEPALEGMEPALLDAVRRALSKDPARRPTAQQLLDHLVGRTSPAESLTHASHPTWAPTAPHGPQTLGMPAPPEPAPTLTPPARARRRVRRPVLAAAGVAAVLAIAATTYTVLASDGPPENLQLLFHDDFTQTGTGWGGTRYNATDGLTYGYAPEGFYAIDVNGESPSRSESAPIAFLPKQPATPKPYDKPLPTLPTDLLLSIDTSLRGAPSGKGEYGLFCRAAEGYKATRYEFLLDTGGHARIRRVVEDRGVDLTSAVPVSMTSDGRTRLQAECAEVDGALRLSLWVNGTLAQQVTDDSPLAAGEVGILARVGEQTTSAMKASFDNFTMHGPKAAS